MKIVNYQVEYCSRMDVVWRQYSLGYADTLAEARSLAVELKSYYPHAGVRVVRKTLETVK